MNKPVPLNSKIHTDTRLLILTLNTLTIPNTANKPTQIKLPALKPTHSLNSRNPLSTPTQRKDRHLELGAPTVRNTEHPCSELSYTTTAQTHTPSATPHRTRRDAGKPSRSVSDTAARTRLMTPRLAQNADTLVSFTKYSTPDRGVEATTSRPAGLRLGGCSCVLIPVSVRLKRKCRIDVLKCSVDGSIKADTGLARLLSGRLLLPLVPLLFPVKDITSHTHNCRRLIRVLCSQFPKIIFSKCWNLIREILMKLVSQSASRRAG